MTKIDFFLDILPKFQEDSHRTIFIQGYKFWMLYSPQSNTIRSTEDIFEFRLGFSPANNNEERFL